MQRFFIGLSIWWLIAVAGATLMWPSAWLNPTTMQHKTILGIPLMINGWHILFHLVSAGIALLVATRNFSPVAWSIGAGALYLSIGIVALSGHRVLGVVGMMPNDTVGNTLHVTEGSLMLVVGIAAQFRQRREQGCG